MSLHIISKQTLKYIAAITAVVAVLMLAGCSSPQASAPQASSNAATSQAPEAATSSASTEAASSSAAATESSAAAASTSNQQAPASSAPAANQPSISEQDAKDIALKHAGVNASDAQFVKVGQDQDNGITKWEIDFTAGDTKFDYDVNASTGEIISFESEVKGGGAAPAANQGAANANYIDEATAKEAALSHAGYAESDVTAMKCELDAHDAQPHYDISFKANGMEYDYDIDPVNGNVLSFEEDVDD